VDHAVFDPRNRLAEAEGFAADRAYRITTRIEVVPHAFAATTRANPWPARGTGPSLDGVRRGWSKSPHNRHSTKGPIESGGFSPSSSPVFRCFALIVAGGRRCVDGFKAGLQVREKHVLTRSLEAIHNVPMTTPTYHAR
jgi:hypothetical protein